MSWTALLSEPPSRPLILGVLNVSPESFYPGSISSGKDDLGARVARMELDGADAIDIGARSTAPYLETAISPDEEVARLREAVRVVRAATKLPISADTTSAAAARAALEEGADCINDVSGLKADPAMAALIANARCGAILMARENEATFLDGEEPADAVSRLLSESLVVADAAGIANNAIALDPGIGFFRSRSVIWHSWDLALLRSCRELRHRFGRPIVIGASRKSFIGALLGRTDPEERLAGSLAAAAWCAMDGVEMLRVHDVRETFDALRMVQLLEARGVAAP